MEEKEKGVSCMKIYYCEKCEEEVWESWPRYQPFNNLVYCEDCAFILGFTTADEYMMFRSFPGRNYPIVIDGKIHISGCKDPTGRKSDLYRWWRKRVLERDNFTCRHCGENDGNKLAVHHIKSYDKHPESRLQLENGVTLCKSCHRKAHGRNFKCHG